MRIENSFLGKFVRISSRDLRHVYSCKETVNRKK